MITAVIILVVLIIWINFGIAAPYMRLVKMGCIRKCIKVPSLIIDGIVMGPIMKYRSNDYLKDNYYDGPEAVPNGTRTRLTTCKNDSQKEILNSYIAKIKVLAYEYMSESKKAWENEIYSCDCGNTDKAKFIKRCVGLSNREHGTGDRVYVIQCKMCGSEHDFYEFNDAPHWPIYVASNRIYSSFQNEEDPEKIKAHILYGAPIYVIEHIMHNMAERSSMCYLTSYKELEPRLRLFNITDLDMVDETYK